ALVTPQAPPETTRTPPPRTPRTTAPTVIDQAPRSPRAQPRALGTAATGGGTRRRCTSRLMPATTATRAGHAPAAIPSGPDDGSGALPNRPAPLPITSANNVAVVPSNGVWARNPAPLPTATNRRQAEVKPNREWNNATPCLTPSSSS